MKKAKRIGVLAAVVLGVTVILQNTQPVETRLLFVKITMPNAILLGLTLLIGTALGILIALAVSGQRGRPKE